MYIIILLEPTDPLFNIISKFYNAGNVRVSNTTFDVNIQRTSSTHIYIAGKLDLVITALRSLGVMAGLTGFDERDYQRYVEALRVAVVVEKARLYRQMTGRTYDANA